MPEVVTYIENENLIHVKSIGNLTSDEVRSSIIEVAKLYKSTRAKNVLVDQLEAQSFPANAQGFNLGSHVAHLLKGANIAIVHSRDVKEDIEFFEKVTQIRGGNMKVFSDLHAAKTWISEQSK